MNLMMVKGKDKLSVLQLLKSGIWLLSLALILMITCIELHIKTIHNIWWNSTIINFTWHKLSYYQKTVNEPLLIINKDLDEFFAYLNRDKENIDFVHVTKDEFGRMSKKF